MTCARNSGATALTGGLNWALGRVDANVSPNLATAAPQASELPKFDAKPKKKKGKAAE